MSSPSNSPLLDVRRRVRVVIAGLLLVILALFTWAAGTFSARSEPAKPATDSAMAVRVATAIKRDVPRFVTIPGTAQAFNAASIHTRVDGEIRRVAFDEGSLVRRGQVLVELDPRPFEAQLKAAQAQTDKDRAQLENARVDLERYKFLVETDSGSRQTFDTAQAQVKQLEATVAYDAAQAEMARLQLEYATIRSPFDGRAGARLIDVGNIVHPGDATALVVVTQTAPIGVTFAIPQNVLESVRKAQRDARVPVDALKPDSGEPIDSGYLTLIDNQADPATGTVRCKALFPNRAELLWPGVLVSVRVRVGTYRDAVVVPAQAIQPGPKGTYVYVAQDGVAKMRPVTLGTIEGDVAAIVQGLKEGEVVVTEGQFRIEPDSRISVPK